MDILLVALITFSPYLYLAGRNALRNYKENEQAGPGIVKLSLIHSKKSTEEKYSLRKVKRIYNQQVN